MQNNAHHSTSKDLILVCRYGRISSNNNEDYTMRFVGPTKMNMIAIELIFPIKNI